jgi:hypothetical protein
MASVLHITTADVVDPAIACDPLQRRVSLPLRREWFPLGFPAEISTNSSQVLDAAGASWDYWKHRIFPGPGITIHISVTEDRENALLPAPIFRGREHLVSVVADAHNYAVCDVEKSFAFAWLSQDAVADPLYLRYHFLEGIALTMLGGGHVLPLHAACVERAGKGVLLCGNSGSGKSSLAYACARAGWNFLSDDASYLVSNSVSRLVVGNPQRLRMRPSAKQLFPEIAALDLTPHPTTKPSIEIPTAQLSLTTAQCTTVEHVVFLNRNHDGPAALLPFARPMALAWASQSWKATQDKDEEAPGHNRLLNAKLHEMRYRDLEDAIRLLERMVVVNGPDHE